MAERRFNPLDPLGIIELLTDVTREAPPVSPTREADIKKFLADVNKNIPDEQMAQQEYRRMAMEADRLGFHSVAATLTQMSQDEGRHERNLRDMAITIW